MMKLRPPQPTRQRFQALANGWQIPKRTCQWVATGKTGVFFAFLATLGAVIGLLMIAPTAAPAQPPAADSAVKMVKVKGADFVPLRQFVTRYGLSKHTVDSRTWTFKSRWTQIEFTDQSRMFHYNGVLVYLVSPLQRLPDRDWGVSKADFYKTFEPLLRPQSHLAHRGWKTVLIDPGHGGMKDGTVSPTTKMREKAATLDLSQRLARRLTAAGYRVMMTRNSDKDVSLASRAAAAKSAKADLFISLHFNSGPSSATGIETFVLSVPGTRSTHDNGAGTPDKTINAGNATDAANMILGLEVHTAMVRKTRARDRGLKRARFQVIRENTCPAILVEGGFLSNPGEAKKIATVAYRDTLALALFNGIEQYFGRVKLAQGR